MRNMGFGSFPACLTTASVQQDMAHCGLDFRQFNDLMKI
jgi:hypothetical protein